MEKKILLNDDEVTYKVISKADNSLTIVYLGKVYCMELWPDNGSLRRVISLDGINKSVHRFRDSINLEGRTFKVLDPRGQRAKGGAEDHGAMVSPMPGKILQVLVSKGDSVTKGQALLVMEAMKMEHTIKASEDGIVAEVHFKEGELVSGGAELIELNQDS